MLRALLEETVLPLAFSQGQRWLATWAFWMLGRRDLAVQVIIVSSSISSCRRLNEVLTASCSEDASRRPRQAFAVQARHGRQSRPGRSDSRLSLCATPQLVAADRQGCPCRSRSHRVQRESAIGPQLATVLVRLTQCSLLSLYCTSRGLFVEVVSSPLDASIKPRGNAEVELAFPQVATSLRSTSCGHGLSRLRPLQAKRPENARTCSATSGVTRSSDRPPSSTLLYPLRTCPVGRPRPYLHRRLQTSSRNENGSGKSSARLSRPSRSRPRRRPNSPLMRSDSDPIALRPLSPPSLPSVSVVAEVRMVQCVRF